MKKKNWLELDDYMQVIGLHIFLFIFIYFVNNSTGRIILFEIGNIAISILILKLKNLLEESRIKREAKKQARIEEYKEQVKNDQN